MTPKTAAVVPIRSGLPGSAPRPAEPNPQTSAGAFAEQMRRSREQRKLSLQQIADRTKIGISQLRALERGDLKMLPGGIYRRAMIRQYADAVGVNAEDALRELVETPETRELANVPQTIQAAASDRASVGFSTALWTAALALCILGAIGASLGPGWYREAAGVASIPQAEQPVQAAQDEGLVEPGGRDIELQAEAAPVLPGADAPTTEGELRITSDPEGAQVTVNGIGWSDTPVTIRYLPFGEKLVRVTKSGYDGQQQSVDITSENPSRSIRVVLSAIEPPP